MRYEFKCPNCGAKRVVQLKIEERDITQPCECGAKMERVIAPIQWIPRCSGFYRTDNVLLDRNEADAL